MKHKKVLISLIFVAVLTQALGTVLNRIVVFLNGGMPSIDLGGAFGKWVPINQATKLPLLTDVIRLGIVDVSVGDLFIITGIVMSMIAIWIALPPGRKFFPLLVASVLGAFWSASLPNDSTSTLLFITGAVGTILAMYWKYRSSNKILDKVINLNLKRALQWVSLRQPEGSGETDLKGRNLDGSGEVPPADKKGEFYCFSDQRKNLTTMKSERGFTLVEVLAGMAIMALIAIAFLGSITTAIGASNQTNVRTKAESLATAQMETIKSGGYNSAVGGIANYTVIAPSGFRFDTLNAGVPQQQVPNQVYGIAWDIANNVPLTGSDPGIQKITIIVESNLELGSGGTYKEIVRLTDFKAK